MLSIIIPAYNEEKRIEKTLKELDTFRKTNKEIKEVIVVTDGSTDRTAEIARKYADRVIELKKNKGKGFAVKKGFQKAKQRYSLFMDSDLATPLKEIPKFVKLTKKYDIIIASRNTQDANITSYQPMHRRILGKLFPLITNTILGLHVKDSQCGFKLLKTSVAKQLFNKQKIERWAFDAELLYLAQKANIPVKEVGVTWHDQEGSKINTVKDGFKMLKDILKIRFANYSK